MGDAVSNGRFISKLKRGLPAWNINGVAELIISLPPAVMQDYGESRKHAIRDLVQFESQLRDVSGLQVFSPQSNFVYVRIPSFIDGEGLRNHLLSEYGFLVRQCGNKIGSDSSFFRFVVRPPPESRLLVSALKETFLRLLKSS